MKHTECEDCKLREGDCGYHFKMDGKTNYDIASLSACDKYGNCMFFKAKAKPQGDLISREALKAYARTVICGDNPTNSLIIRMFDEIIDNAPSASFVISPDYVTELQNLNKELIRQLEEAERPQGEWKETGYETGALGITYRQTQCSNCGWEHALPMWWNFCPNCGAKMQKGGAE